MLPTATLHIANGDASFFMRPTVALHSALPRNAAPTGSSSPSRSVFKSVKSCKAHGAKVFFALFYVVGGVVAGDEGEADYHFFGANFGEGGKIFQNPQGLMRQAFRKAHAFRALKLQVSADNGKNSGLPHTPHL